MLDMGQLPFLKIMRNDDGVDAPLNTTVQIHDRELFLQAT